jgi:hypothetical protein
MLRHTFRTYTPHNTTPIVVQYFNQGCTPTATSNNTYFHDNKDIGYQNAESTKIKRVIGIIQPPF